jgi:segregation and condensation protein A
MSASAAPVLEVDGFEGPLDWLLELARAERVDLRKLSILALVEAFATALQLALASPSRVDLSRWGEFLSMAAQLALLRSRLLLPSEVKAAQAEAEALRRQLVETEALRRAASWLDARPQLGRDTFGRGVTADERMTSVRVPDIADLLRACLVSLRVPEQADHYAPGPPPLWRVQDAVARITRMLEQRPDGGVLGEFLPRVERDQSAYELRCRAAVASTLVAGLELCRGGGVRLTQAASRAPIRIEAASLSNSEGLG